MAEQWYYTHGVGQQRVGPISKDALKQAAAGGELTPQDLVWRVGLPQWAEASTVPELFANVTTPAAAPETTPVASDVAATSVAATAPVRPVAAAPMHANPAAPATIGYYSGPGGLPPRAAKTLSGHARPLGDTYTWPCDDALVAQWDRTLKLRKKISAAAQLYRALLFLAIISAVILGLVGVFTIGSRKTQGEAIVMLVLGGIMTAFCVLYFFMWRATTRSKRWAPLTYFIICLVLILANAASMAMVVANTSSSVSTGSTAPAVAGGLFGMILPAIFAVVSWKAYAAIPDYLMQPAWCQEMIVKANL